MSGIHDDRSLAMTSLRRREALEAMGGLGLAAVTLPLTSVASRAAGGDPLVYTWAGYDVPEMHQAYTAKYAASPEFALFADQEEALQKIMAGFSPDTCHPCSQDIRKWRDAGVIKPVDTSRLGNWPDVWPDLQNLVAMDGATWMVPVDWGNSSYCYREDLVDAGEESWAVLMDPKYQGQISLYDGMDAVLAAALAIGITDPYHMTDDELARVKEAMLAQRDLVRFYWSSPSDYQQAMAAGEVVLATCWNDGPVALQAQGLPVRMARPKEGIITWVCGIVLVEGGEGDEQKVYDFVDAFISPETGAFEIDSYGYGHSNRKAFDLVDPARLEALGYADPAGMWRTGIFAIEGTPGLRDKWVTLLEEVKAGI